MAKSAHWSPVKAMPLCDCPPLFSHGGGGEGDVDGGGGLGDGGGGGVGGGADGGAPGGGA